MSKTTVAVRHFALGGCVAPETAVNCARLIHIIRNVGLKGNIA